MRLPWLKVTAADFFLLSDNPPLVRACYCLKELYCTSNIPDKHVQIVPVIQLKRTCGRSIVRITLSVSYFPPIGVAESIPSHWLVEAERPGSPPTCPFQLDAMNSQTLVLIPLFNPLWAWRMTQALCMPTCGILTPKERDYLCSASIRGNVFIWVFCFYVNKM